TASIPTPLSTGGSRLVVGRLAAKPEHFSAAPSSGSRRPRKKSTKLPACPICGGHLAPAHRWRPRLSNPHRCRASFCLAATAFSKLAEVGGTLVFRRGHSQVRR